MNGSYFNSGFPGTGLDNNTVPNQQSMPNYQNQNSFSGPIEEQSYIENILRLNMCRNCQIHKCQHLCSLQICRNILNNHICDSWKISCVRHGSFMVHQSCCSQDKNRG